MKGEGNKEEEKRKGGRDEAGQEGEREGRRGSLKNFGK